MIFFGSGKTRSRGRSVLQSLALIFLTLCLVQSARAGTRTDGAGNSITLDVIGSGGGLMTSGALTLNGTAGQVAVGFSSASPNGISHGVYPSGEGEGEGEGQCPPLGATVTGNLDDDVCLSFPSGCPVHPAAPNFQWFRQGDPVALLDSTHYFGVGTDTLCVNNIQAEDAGTFVLHYNDDTNAPQEYSVTLVVILVGLPVSNVFTLVLLTILGALGGVIALRGRKTT